jgi:HTH-type transcriptional regulator / antitoxin HigA
MRKYRTLQDYTEQYFKKQPQEIDAFLKESFEEYAKDGDSDTLLSQLRVMARVKGISSIAEQIGVTRQGLQKAFPKKEIPV